MVPARPRLILSALRGGAGKTTVSLALAAAWRSSGLRAAVFKKGPDYIDAGWLAKAAGSTCRNLDPYLTDWDAVSAVFHRASAEADVALIEGNRGLFDGLDVSGSTSTAELAKRLQAPVVLILDATKATRTLAALVLGCRHFDPEVNLAGVILNHIAGARHEKLIRDCLAASVGLPVLGALPRFRLAMPERHMGLVPTYEHPAVAAAIKELKLLAEAHLDLAGLLAVARSAPPLPPLVEPPAAAPAGPRVRIGVIQDAAFQFYYPENLEALEAAGAEVVLISALSDQALPELQGLYIGGGFPETQAQRLAENVAFRRSVREAAGRGLPIYAECGGLMFLARSLTMEGSTFPMAGVLPVDVEVLKRPQGHGYVAATVDRPNPFYPAGATLKGHEFHYSRIVQQDLDPSLTCLKIERGVGLAGGRDGLVVGNVFAAYTHVHALGTKEWARGIVGRAQSGKIG